MDAFVGARQLIETVGFWGFGVILVGCLLFMLFILVAIKSKVGGSSGPPKWG